MFKFCHFFYFFGDSIFIFFYFPLLFFPIILNYIPTAIRTKIILATIELMNQDLFRLDRFDGINFIRYQDKHKCLPTALKIFFVLDLSLEPIGEATDENSKEVWVERKKRQGNELICRGHILNLLSYRLYDLYTNTISAKEI